MRAGEPPERIRGGISGDGPMLIRVPIILVAGVLGLITPLWAARAGVFQKRIRQNGLTVYNRGVRQLVEAGHLRVREPAGGEQWEEPDKPVQGAAE